MLVFDDDLVIWAPTAQSVEPEREREQPNAIFLKGPVVEKLEAAVGADQSQVLPDQAEIGREALRPEELRKTVNKLEANPPAPFDLAQKARVFSTRFQFVEFEVRGAEWTERRVKISSFLLNADLPEEMQKILETHVHPFQSAADIAFNVPLLVNGKPAYNQDGTRMKSAEKQSDIAKKWVDIRDRYLRKIRGFGWLIQKDCLEKFNTETKAYEESLSAWVKAFKEYIETEEDKLIGSIVSSISSRLERSSKKQNVNLQEEVKRGLQRMRMIEPKVRIVLKNVSWESSCDEEFNTSLRNAFSEDELKGWFEEFTAAKQQE